MATVTLRNTNPVGAVFLPLLGRTLEAGEEFEVDAAVAGRAPKGDPADEDYDIGEGLLAQIGNYELVVKTSGKK